jgi:hypothetical protein
MHPFLSLDSCRVRVIAHISLPTRIIEEIIRTTNKALDVDNNND